MARLATCRKNLRRSAEEISRLEKKLRRAEKTFLVTVKIVCEEDPDIDEFSISAATASAFKEKVK